MQVRMLWSAAKALRVCREGRSCHERSATNGLPRRSVLPRKVCERSATKGLRTVCHERSTNAGLPRRSVCSALSEIATWRELYTFVAGPALVAEYIKMLNNKEVNSAERWNTIVLSLHTCKCKIVSSYKCEKDTQLNMYTHEHTSS